MSRRGFLQAGMAGLGGLGLSDLLRLRAQANPAGAPDTAVILVWLPGGPLGSEWARRSGTPSSLLGHAANAGSQAGSRR